MRERLRTGLLIAVIACWVGFLTYQVAVETTPGREVRRHTVGLPGSPWFLKTVEEENGRVVGLTTRLTLWSWSWLALAGAVILFGVWKQLRPPAEPGVTP